MLQNPMMLPYLFLRTVVRMILGRERRNIVFWKLGWKRLSLFLESLHFPKSIIINTKIIETQESIKKRPFHREIPVCSILIKKRGKVFIDIGANYGFYSFLLHNNFDTVLAIEPYPDNLWVIQGVKKKYNYSKVKIIPRAIGDKNGFKKLYIGRHSGAHNILFPMGYGFITIKVTTLSKLLEPYNEVDLIKADVQGSEYTILEQSKNIIHKIKSWMIETHTLTENDDIALRNEQTIKLLENYNYKILQVDENHIYAWRN